MNVDLSETVRVEVEGTTTLLFIPQIATANKTGNPCKRKISCLVIIVTITVFFAMGGLQVVGPGVMSLNLEATKMQHIGANLMMEI